MEVTLATINCACQQQPIESIAKIVHATVNKTSSARNPDLLAFGVQEVAPVKDTLLGRIDPYLKPIYKGIESSLQDLFPQKSYRRVAERWTGGIGLIVYSPLQCSAETFATNFGNYWSSAKGAVGIRLLSGGASYTFVCTHLPAHRGTKYVEMRNNAYKILANGLRFGDKGIYDSNHLFVFGDLNYRAAIDGEEVQSLLANFDFEQHDELTTERQNGNVLWGLDEAPIQFNPTFKYYPDTQNFNYKRSPAWTDRIFFSDKNAKIWSYDSVQNVTTTDHRPVYLSLTVQPNAQITHIDIPEAMALPEQVTLAIDRTLGGGLFLTTTKIGWVVLGIMVVGLFFIF